jgi:hypothetical protein
MLDTEIRRHLGLYAANDLSLGEFEEWFIPETWDVERQPNESLRDLTLAIMRLLVKCSIGQLTEGELRRDFGILSRDHWFNQVPKTVRLLSTAHLIREDLPAQAGTSHAAGSA